MNAHVTGGMAVGGLVGLGTDEGALRNSYFTGSVAGDMGVGALVGLIGGSIIINSHYNYDEVLINGQNMISIGALFGRDFEEWLANDKFLNVNERLSQENGYYLINDVSDFKELLAFGQNDTMKFRLTNDLDLGGDPNFYIPCLAGEFDGSGHRISALTFNFDFVSQVGLFGCLASDGKVTQVGVEDVSIVGACSVGGLVGANWGSPVSDCYVTGSVTGRFTLPAIGNEEDAGGLVGWNYGAVTNCYFTGSVSGNHNVGGLVGFNCYGSVNNSYFRGIIAGAASERVGGLVGFNAGTVSNSYSIGSVSGSVSVGGLVGTHNEGTVSNSYSTCNVTGNVTMGGMVGAHLGGLVGSNHDAVSRCYCTGTVIGTDYVGGLTGWNTGTIGDSYSTGSVSGDNYVGGLAGFNAGTVSDSFWDTQTSGQSNSAGGTGKATGQMKNIATFSGVTWNITAVASAGTRNPSYIWNIVDGVTYPFLSWQR